MPTNSKKPHDTGYAKLGPTISFKVPEHTKKAYDNLSIQQRHEAIEKCRIVIAKAIYDAGFDPYKILGES